MSYVFPRCFARWIAFVAALLVLTEYSFTAIAQGWQRVVSLNDAAGSAIGGSGDNLYSGLAGGQVYRSSDNGLTWTLATGGLVDSAGRMLTPKAFLVTATGRVIRAGDNASWNNKIGSPIFYSDNQGALWNEVPLPFGSPTSNPAGIGVSDIVAHKGSIYFSDLLSGGVWKSSDNGLSWISVGAQLPTMPFVGNTRIYYAVASSGDALLTVQPAKGVFRSTDGGVTWSQSVNGIAGVPDSPLVGGRTWNSTDVVGSADGTAFAVSDNRLYRSRDAGASWVEIGAEILRSPNPFAPAVIGPAVRKVELLGDRVYVTTIDSNPRFFEGENLGESWVELPRVSDNNANASILAQSFHAQNGALYFAGNKGIHRLNLATAVRTNIAPIVTTTPAGPFGVNVGSTLGITASARGTAPFTYEWRLNSSPIAGQTSAELNFTASNTNQSGAIVLVVRNAAGATTNQVGQIIVVPSGPGHVDYSFRPQTPGTVTTFAIARDGSVFYGGPFSSQTEAYTGVRHVFPDGQVDPGFVSGATVGVGTGPGLSVGSPRTLLPMGDGSVLVGAGDTSNNARYYRRLLASGALDASWPWPEAIAGAPRKIVRLADGKFLIAGGSVGGIHRLNADGTLDPTFQSPASIGRFQASYVSDFVVLSSGHILIAGNFTEVDTVQRIGIARLRANGTLDGSWVPAQLNFGSQVHTLSLLSDGRLLLGGNFITVGGQPRRGLARLLPNGSLDTTLGDVMPNISPSPVVNALALQPDGKVWVGGSFFAFAGRNYLVRLNADGTLDSTMPDVGLETSGGGPVNALQLSDDGRLWIAATSATIRGRFVGQLFRIFTDRSGPATGFAGLDQTPDLGASISLQGYVSSPFTGLQWRFQGVPIQGANGLQLPLEKVTGAMSGSYELVVTSSGGSHTSAPVNVRIRGPVVLDQGPAPTVGILSNSASFTVSAFGRSPLGYQWFRDGTALANATNAALTLTNLQLSAAGDYSVRVTGGDGSTVTSSPAFLTVIPQPGTPVSPFSPGLFPTRGNFLFTLNGIGFASEGRVLISGSRFGTVTNSTTESLLVRLNTDGSVDESFRFDSSGLLEMVSFKVLPDGRILVLVRTNQGGGPYQVQRLNADGTRDPGFAVFTVSPGYGMDIGPDGSVYVIGNSIVRLSPSGVEDAAFGSRARVNSALQSVSVDPAGRIYITGGFTTVGGAPRSQIARLLADGSLDTTFAPTNVFSSTWTVSALGDGALVSDLRGFYRFNESGRLDPDYAWSRQLTAFSVTPSGGLIGVLPSSDVPEAVILTSGGTGALPFSRISIPRSPSGPYTFIRVAPDGAIWAAYGGTLIRLNGTVTPLAMVTHPKPQIALAGATLTLTGGATGTSRIGYQWRRNGINLPGETNALLTLTRFSAEMEGDYTLVATNQSGTITSTAASVALLSAPAIITQPASVVASAGQPAQFDVTAKGLQLRYQWRSGTADIPNATNATLVLASVNAASGGSYSVRIVNPAGEVVSREARLRVRPSSGGGGSVLPGLATRLRFENSLVDEVVGLTTTTVGAPTFVAGTEGEKGVSLRGGSDWLQLGNPNAGAGGRLTDEKFTVAFWIKPESPGSLNVYSLIMLTPNANLVSFTAREHLLYLGGNDNLTGGASINLYTRTFNSITSTDSRASVQNLVGKWTHFAIVYRGTSPANPDNFSVFVNGQGLPLRGGSLISGTVSLVNALGRYTPAARFQLDDFQVYNRALSTNEVASLLQPAVSAPPPGITIQPVGGTVSAGGGFSFNVAATGENLFYEWYRGTTILSDADGPVLTLNNLSTAEAGDYRVVISNNGGSTNSATARLVVNASASPFVTWAAAAGLSGDNAQPGADADRDGANNLAEFYYATSPTTGGEQPAFAVGTTTVGSVSHPTVTITRRQDAGTAQLSLRVSTSILFADELGSTIVSTTPLGNGLERVVFRSNVPEAGGKIQFFRFTVQQ